jgi:hypothetical protein
MLDTERFLQKPISNANLVKGIEKIRYSIRVAKTVFNMYYLFKVASSN